MQTQILEQDDTRAKFKVEVSAGEVTDAYGRVLRELARQVRVPGFRPGKAPRGVIEARVGKDAVAQEVRDALVQLNYPKAVHELSLTPLAQHIHAHEPVEGEAYSFEVEVELYPVVTLPELSEIVIDTEKPPLTEEMVQETIENLQRQHATLIPVERPAEAGDYLLLEMGEEGSSLPLDLETVSPLFAEQFYGKAIGDEVEVTLDDPDAEGDESDELEAQAAEGDAQSDVAASLSEGALGNAPDGDQDAAVLVSGAQGDEDTDQPTAPTMRVLIKDIKAKERPELDDEFAQTLGFDTWAEAEARVRESLAAQLEQEALAAQQEEFTEKLALESDPHVPQSLKERRKASLLQNLARDLEGRGLTMEAYLEKLDQDEKRAEFETELEEAAESAVKRDLVLEKLLEARGTRLSNEEFDAAIAFMAQRQNSTPAKLRQELGETGLENYRFLLTRDKAVRESVRELLGEPEDAPQETGGYTVQMPSQDEQGQTSGAQEASGGPHEENSEDSDETSGEDPVEDTGAREESAQ